MTQPPAWGAAPAAAGVGEAGGPLEQPADLKARVKVIPASHSVAAGEEHSIKLPQDAF